MFHINHLNSFLKEFDLILPILSASVPLIKLQINIINEIDSNLIQFSPYFENKDISKNAMHTITVS